MKGKYVIMVLKPMLSQNRHTIANERMVKTWHAKVIKLEVKQSQCVPLQKQEENEQDQISSLNIF